MAAQEFQEDPDLIQRQNTGIFGREIIVDGINLSRDEGPICLQMECDLDEYSETCDDCEYFIPSECLLKFDDALIDDLLRITLLRKEQEAAQGQRGRNDSQIIFDELKSHGRPLHYTVIAKIVQDRYPFLKMTENRVNRLLYWHPELFEKVDKGVYQSK